MNEELLSNGGALGRIQVLRGPEETETLINGQLFMKWANGDETAERMVIVQMYETGKGTQEEIAGAFGVHVNTVYKYINSYKADGTAGLANQLRGPKEAWKITAGIKFKVLEIAFKNRGMGLEGIVKQLKQQWNEQVSINSVRSVLLENGVLDETVKGTGKEWEQGELFIDGELALKYGKNAEEVADEGEVTVKEKEEKAEETQERENKLRREYSGAQRIYLDRLERDTAGMYIERGEYSAYAGGLLFAPLLKRHEFNVTIKRVLEAIETQEGYSIDELITTLFYYDVFGYRSIEDFKTVYREEFGVLIGKSSSPSIYTLRRFLEKERALECGERLMEEFAKGYLESGLVTWGVLYIDDHFLPYHGKQTITMGWFTVRGRPLKGGSNFMAVDGDYNPFIFMVRPSSEDLLEKIPEIIKKAKMIGRSAGIKDETLKIIFDREGYSAELFRELSDEKSESYVQFISWAKYTDVWVNEFKDEEFRSTMRLKYKIQDSDEIEYFETERNMNKYGKIRTIVIRSGRKKQRAAIYTNDKNSLAEEIISLICTRWGQENVFKALKENHCIDYFPGKGLYDCDELEEQPMVDNDEIRALKQERAVLVTRLNKFKLNIADKVLSLREKKEKIDWDELKKEELEMMSAITGIESAITIINDKISKLPKEIKFDEAHNGTRLYELDYEKKRFLDCIKIFSYHMQKQMCMMLLNHYDKKKEIWPAMRMIVNRGGNIRLEKGKLVVRLKRFSDQEIDYAARHLCEDLNKMNPVTMDRFEMPIRYEVA
ncbi:MAG: putative transposase [Endomicrobiales bacterium]